LQKNKVPKGKKRKTSISIDDETEDAVESNDEPQESEEEEDDEEVSEKPKVRTIFIRCIYGYFRAKNARQEAQNVILSPWKS
jgi:hypothetical protein